MDLLGSNQGPKVVADISTLTFLPHLPRLPPNPANFPITQEPDPATPLLRASQQAPMELTCSGLHGISLHSHPFPSPSCPSIHLAHREAEPLSTDTVAVPLVTLTSPRFTCLLMGPLPPPLLLQSSST